MSLPPGTSLGPYRVLAPLGAGGMGEVCRARDDRLGRDVAIKVLTAEFAADSDRLRRFEQEARAASALNHPNVLTVFDVGTHEGVPYIVTELLEGETLRERLCRERLPWRKAVEIAAAIADGLAAAHDKGIVHRDLKPENIFLTRDGRVKILDFGLARLAPASVGESPAIAATETLPGTVLGTVGYMAPEQVRGEPADARSDIFAFGCLLYEMLTGKQAFQRDTAAETMTAILKEPVPDVSLFGPEISAELDRIVAHCLEKNPGERFRSASDLAFDVRALARSATRAAGTIPVAWRRRAALVTLLVAVCAVIVWRWGGGATRRGAGGGPERIAVLPFENLGASDDAYFAIGVTDEIIGRLASVRGLAVLSRTSAFQYAGTTKSTRQIGNELGVDYLLTGTVRWARGQGATDRVRITPQLIRAADDTSLWAEVYEFALDDIFRAQSDMARAVVAQLGLTLLERERESLEVRPTENLEAYQAFLRGRFIAGQPHFTLSAWFAALGEFERAVTLDPDFALAWAELSRGHGRLVYYRYDLSQQRRDLARRALERARELAAGLPEVHLASGYYHLWVERDPVTALAEFEAASAGLPNSAELQEAKGELFRLRGDWQRALDAYRAALSFSPRNVNPTVEIALTLWWMRRYREALAAADQAIVLAPDQPWSHLAKVFTLWSWKGRDGLDAARAALESVAKDHEWAAWTWYWQEAFEGRDAEALRRLEESPGDWVRIKIDASPKVLLAALAHARLDEVDQARAEFEAARRLLEAEVLAAPDDGRYHTSLGIACAALGLRDEALREGHRGVELLPLSQDAVYGIPHLIGLAHIHTLLGEPEAALGQLEMMLSAPGWISVPWLRVDPTWDPLRSDPRFQALLSKYEVKP